MTPLLPYEAYEEQAAAGARLRYRKAQIPLPVVFGAVGAVIAYVLSDQERIGMTLVGIGLGAAAGLGIYWILVKSKTSNDAEQAYTAAWCAEHACTAIGDGHKVLNGPYANSGHNPQWSDAVEGVLEAVSTLFYNFSYYTTQSSGKTTSEVEHPYRIMRLTGPQLPVASLSFAKRGVFGSIGLFDSIDSAVTKQHVVELESVDFNEEFKLEVDDGADEIWIRRVFDPATIDAVLTGKLPIPNIQYYDGCWWMAETGHYKIRELDAMLGWQATALPGIQHLARVPEL